MVGFVGLPLLAGVVSGSVGSPALAAWYHGLTLPPGVPPDWAFGAVWAAIYALMGLAAWMVWRHGRRQPPARPLAARALRLWGWQLLVNAAWVPCFFGLRSPGLGLLVVLLLLGLVAATARVFVRVDRQAGRLMFPSLVWTCYAAYLNVGVWVLNPH